MLYVSYGSNLNREQMARRCPDSVVVGTGVVRGWKIVFNFHSDIIETEQDEDTVPVVIWEVSEKDFINLDRYEGCPDYYIRREINVENDDGSNCIGTVYVMADDKKGVRPPDRGYFNTVLKGAVESGIDTMYLYDALEHAYDEEERSRNNVVEYR